MQKTCAHAWCASSFTISDRERSLLTQFGIDREPEHCPTCRHLLRGQFFPRLILHRSTSALSGEPIITIYNPAKKFPIYSVKEWWSDAWDGLSYGHPFDFSKSFFPQFDELLRIVPRMANKNENSENCEFSYSCGNAKNVYYSEIVHRSEDVYYSKNITGYNTMICDSLRCFRSSYLHECVLCQHCHYSTYLFRCSETRDSHFCIDCRGCSNCLFSCNLRNRSYCIGNEQVTKEEFEKVKAQTIDGSFSTLQQNLEKWKEVYAKAIFRDVYLENCEDSTGDALVNCARCEECYDCLNCVDDLYCWNLSPSEQNVSSLDLTSGGIGELLYNSTGLGGGNYFIRMCAHCRLSSNLSYCIECYSCKNCFGCTGLRGKQYCIFNQQLTKNEYERNVDQLTQHMKKTREWGQFFPLSLSPFAYNESLSMYYHSLSKEEARKRDWSWEDLPEYHLEGTEHSDAIPDGIDGVKDDICERVLTCAETGRKFKIQPQELVFLRILRVPLPRVHPDVRMERRLAMLNPYALFPRSCHRCSKPIQSSYAPDRPEAVYCESCYLAAVY
ncbi:MAG: hypothetical protein Q7R81_01130 [Candidatus Peregrinibacteria bacterium]|nr:hypothetical protein [Candidatus Peregrinibacteria bacterium]